MNKFCVFLIFTILLTSTLLSSYENALEVRTDVPGVKIYLNETYQGVTEEFDIYIWRKDNLTPNSYTLKCTYKDFEPNIQTIKVEAEGPTVVEIEFKQMEVKAEKLTDYDKGEQIKQTGTIIVRSKPTGANVFMDGQKQKETSDVRLTPVSIGQRKIKVKFGSKPPLEISFYLSPNETITVTADFFNKTISTDVKYKYTINSEPQGKLYVDGKYIGKCPQTLKVTQGKLNYKITKNGYETYFGSANVTMNDFITVKLEGLGDLNIDVNKQDAKIYVDGKYIGDGKQTKSVKAGNHEIEIKKYGFKTEKFEVPVEVNKTTYLEANIIEELKPTKKLYTISDLGYERKTWKSYYDKSKEKPESTRNYAICLIGLIALPISLPAMILVDIVTLGDLPPEMEEIGDYPCATIAILSPNMYVQPQDKPDNIYHNNYLKRKAENRASLENNKLIEDMNSKLIYDNSMIESSNREAWISRNIKYRIENGAFIKLK